MDKPFLAQVAHRQYALDQTYGSFVDSVHARDELLRCLGILSCAVDDDSHLEMQRALVTIAANACRMARDVGIETERDAIRLDDANPLEPRRKPERGGERGAC